MKFFECSATRDAALVPVGILATMLQSQQLGHQPIATFSGEANQYAPCTVVPIQKA